MCHIVVQELVRVYALLLVLELFQQRAELRSLQPVGLNNNVCNQRFLLRRVALKLFEMLEQNVIVCQEERTRVRIRLFNQISNTTIG